MKNFKRYNKFKEILHNHYENYLRSCQDRITYLEEQLVIMGDVIKHYEDIMKLANIDFIQINVIYNDFISQKEGKNVK